MPITPDHYREIVVERSDVYVIPMFNSEISTINGWTLDQITEDWFERFSPNTSHATRDAYCLGGGARFIDVTIIPPRIGAFKQPSLEPNAPTLYRTNTGSMDRRGLLTGMVDLNLTPICIGDMLSFDEKQWGGVHIFEAAWSEGELNVGEGDQEWLTTIKFWDRQ